MQKLDAQTVREWGQRYSNWGRWGADDERGALNFITPARVLEACALPETGRVISLALPFDDNGPQSGVGGRHNPIHTLQGRIGTIHPSSAGAGAHRDHPLRLSHLLVNSAHHLSHLVGDCASNDHTIGLAR